MASMPSPMGHVTRRQVRQLHKKLRIFGNAPYYFVWGIGALVIGFFLVGVFLGNERWGEFYQRTAPPVGFVLMGVGVALVAFAIISDRIEPRIREELELF